mmetsp:Transcript_137871/g.384440  ORF Transcript_137871/g.384440 Transcript_137871/m.384440 type:complete len:1003 (+) Transcript_137871:61-3069(+)
MEKASLCLDSSGILRGQCSKCAGCRTWLYQGGKKIRFKPEERCGTDESTSAGRSAPCESCGCPAHAHESLEDWLCSARRWVQRLRCSDGAWPEQAPPTATLPVEAKDWAPEAAAIYIVTGGQFEPGRDGRGSLPREAGDGEGLVSVVCTTLEKDQPAHSLLYECFRKQTYEPRELIVVDSGTSPSPFLLERAKNDPRVVYRFFFREEHGLEQAEDPYERVLKRDDPDDIIEWTEYKEDMPDMDRAEVRWEGLSLGLKRNIACHLASGAAIMHFNMNALYAADYLGFMHHELMAEVAQQARWRGKPAEGASIPVAVALFDWHTLDFDDEEVRLMDTERRGYEVPEVKRQQVQYGKGVTYTYTRASWELAPFPDVEEPEGHLAKVLKRENIPFKMVRRPPGHDAMAALGYMKESSSGESATANINLSLEIQLLEMCSASVSLPKAFAEFLPFAREIVSSVKLNKDGGLNALLQAEGACFFCIHCGAAIALRRYLKQIRKLGDGAGGKVEVAQFSRAGGAVGEGVEATYEEPPRRQAPRTGGYGQIPWNTQGLQPSIYSGRGHATGVARNPFTLPVFGGQRLNRPVPGKPLMGIGGRGQSLGLAGRGAQPLVSHRAFGFQSHQAQALAAQARALGGQFPMVQKPRRVMGAANRVPEPEPEDAAWFPGWWRRNAACRQCGNNIGWRYENEERTIFWVLETAFLREREPDPALAAATAKERATSHVDPFPYQPSAAPPAMAPSLPVPHKNSFMEEPTVSLKEAPAPKPVEEPVLLLKEESKDEPKNEPKEVHKVDSKEEPQVPAPQRALGRSGKATADTPLEAGRKAIRAFSPAIQEHLAQSISSPDKAKFDQALNEMKLDDETRKNILQELRIRPGVAATQVEHLVAKGFKARVNALRSLGLRVLRAALQAELPEGTLERLTVSSKDDEAASASGGTAGLAQQRSSGAGAPGPQPAAGEAAGGGRPAALPIPPDWEVVWSEPLQCYQYYDEDGRLTDGPPETVRTP